MSTSMRQGEITLQKIRINRKLKNRKAVAMDVLKMLKGIESKEVEQEKEVKLSKMPKECDEINLIPEFGEEQKSMPN